MRGNRLIDAKPGSVLTSLRNSSPWSPRKKSTRARSRQPSAWNASTAIARMRRAIASSSRAGTSTEARLSAAYLAS